MDASERAHRRAAADGLELRDQIERSDLRTAGDRAAGQHRVEQLGERHLVAQLALDRRDEMRHAGELALREQLRPAHGAGDADARQVVALEIDDHHVLGGVLRPTRPDTPAGRVPLIGDVRTARPRRESSSSGDADTIVQPSPASGAGSSGRSGASACASPPDRRRSRRRQMLHEVDLVDVALGDRGAHGVDRGGVRRPRSSSAPSRRPRTRPATRGTASTGSIEYATAGSGHGSGGAGKPERRNASDAR